MSETAKRIVSGFVLFSLVLGAASYDRMNEIFALVLVLFFGLAGLREFYQLSDRGGQGRPFYKLGFFFSICIVLGHYAEFLNARRRSGQPIGEFYDLFTNWFFPGFSLIPFFLLLLLITAGILQLLSRPLQGTIYSLSVTLFGPIYTVLTISYALLLLFLTQGKFYLLFFLILPIAADIGAYFSGRWFGRHNVGFKVSPRKTYEGYLGAIVFTPLVGVTFLGGAQTWAVGDGDGLALGYLEAAIISFFIAVLSIFGDLIESAIKRDAFVKDSARAVPGHGGILDLADTIYWSLPLGYFYLILRELLGFPLA